MEIIAHRSIPVVSLFSGCGGMDLGFKQVGFFPIVAIETSSSARETYTMNHGPGIAQDGDLSHLSGRDVIKLIERVAPGIRPRAVIGGPPCQSFSRSNVHSRPSDPKHLLPLHYADILRVLNRQYHLDFFLFENVVGLKSKKHEDHYGRILQALEDAGFEVFEEELNASWFGVPQSRCRIFVVGINKELYPATAFCFPRGTPDRALSVRDAIEGLPEPTFFDRSLTPDDIPFHPNHWTMNPRSPKFRRSSENGEPSGSTNGRSFRRLDWDRPSWTVAYGHREIHVHPNGRRRLSIYEAMKLQGFPHKYQLVGNLSQQVTQVSDAVPPPLARTIAKAIRQTIYEPHSEIQRRLLNWFQEHQRAFPWRETTDPYAILVAEKLLQQTSVNDRVVSAYRSILLEYPAVDALAQTKPEDLEPLIGPLGFRYRARELPRLAQTIVSQHAGRVPDNLSQLLSLHGIGDYIARAVLCFAYGQDVPIVDTNVARFLYRVFGLPGNLPSNPARNRKLIHLAANLVPAGNAKDFNLAILDLCAEICTRSNPSCTICPVQELCHQGKTLERAQPEPI